MTTRRLVPPAWTLAAACLCGLAVWIVLFWRLGFSSFWDPDEAIYAEVSREMLATPDWLAPHFNGQPFFDKPVLFYWLQALAFWIFGPTEFAARLTPAISALALGGIVRWLGRELFDEKVGTVAALMWLVLPATFALTRYAILDITFTALLFGGAAAVVVAALRSRPRLEVAGYVLLALAVLTKGPLAIVLAGLSFIVALLVTPAFRPALARCRWGIGLLVVGVIAGPWFGYMWVPLQRCLRARVRPAGEPVVVLATVVRQPAVTFFLRSHRCHRAASVDTAGLRAFVRRRAGTPV